MKRADHHLVQKVLDGDIDPSGFDAFQKRLREDPNLVDLYTGYALLDHTLHEEVEGGGALGGYLDTPYRVSRALVWAAIAAVIALCITSWFSWKWLERRNPPEAAVITFSLDAVWNLDGISRVTGGATGVKAGGTLDLLSGRASISLQPSVHAIIEGPAKIIVISQDTLHLEHGRGFFQLADTGGQLRVTTPKLTVSDAGSGFELQSDEAETDELHVLSGMVTLSANATGDNRTLSAGEMARVSSLGLIETKTSQGRHAPSGLGRFTPVVSGDFAPDRWVVRYGNPRITPRRMEGANFSVYKKLPSAIPEQEDGVMLVTLEIGKSSETPFHTEGWAGMSFYHQGEELLFFGDLFGDRPTWGMDLKHGVPVILPETPLSGAKKVTLRYELRSGNVSLHEGGLPLANPFCAGRLPPGTRFDEIRIAASAGASLAVNSLKIQTRAD